MKVFVNTPNKGTVNMRANPSKNAAILAKIPYGTELTGKIVSNDWIQVEYQNDLGYIMTQYLVETLPKETTISKKDLQRIYNNLKSTLQLIEEVLK